MTVTLRPMRLGEILDRTFQIYRESFWVFVGIAAIPTLLMTGLELADAYWWHVRERLDPHPVVMMGRVVFSVLVSLAFYHISIPIHGVFSPAIVKQTSGMVFGEAGSLSASLGFALRRWLRFLWIGVMMLAATLIAAEAVTVGVFWGMGTAMDAMGLLEDGSNWAFAFLGLMPALGGLLLFLWLVGCFAFGAPACAFEDKRSFKAMGRSWRLSREGRWRVAFTWFLFFLLTLLLSEGINLLLRSGLRTMWTWGVWRAHWMAISAAAMYSAYAVLGSVLGPLYPIAVTLFYYDQRIRKEGFDIEWMMQSAGMTEPAQTQAAAEIAASPAGASEETRA